MRNVILPFVSAAALVSGCGSTDPELEFGSGDYYQALYGEAALDEVRNPVVVIHGILGARLYDPETEKIVWGAFTSQSVDPNEAEGAALIGLPLDPPRSAFDYDPADERVIADGPLGKIEIDVGFDVLEVGVYSDILNSLGVGGYADEVVQPPGPDYASDHFTCHTFFYDWRRDNVENAIQLGKFLQQKRVEVVDSARAKIAKLRAENTEKSNYEASRLERWLDKGFKFDLVAHSMGGLVARYFLRYGQQDLPADGSAPEVTWAGAEDIDRLIIIGTPSFGSMLALVRLVDGFDPGPILPTFRPGLLGSMPALYQLLPRSRHRLVRNTDGEAIDVDLLDPDLWVENRWGLLSDDAARYRRWLQPNVATRAERDQRAETWVRWCLNRTRAFYNAMDSMPTRECPAQITLFAGTSEPTLGSCILETDDETGRLRPIFEGEHLEVVGDGTVPRYSALADERQGTTGRQRFVSPIPWHHEVFLPADHIELTRHPTFVDMMLWQLVEEPVRPITDAR
ncbi:MAG: hypothetical protein AAF196_07985 [Planctomycetota bacterium]